MNFIQFLFSAVVSYACAAMLSSHVFMDITKTDWTNLWTYFWWAVSVPVTVLLFTAIAMVIVCLLAYFLDR